MKADQILFLVLFGVAVLGTWFFIKWADAQWGWWFFFPAIAACFLIAWLIDRRSRNPEQD